MHSGVSCAKIKCYLIHISSQTTLSMRPWNPPRKKTPKNTAAIVKSPLKNTEQPKEAFKEYSLLSLWL